MLAFLDTYFLNVVPVRNVAANPTPNVRVWTRYSPFTYTTAH